MCPCGCQRAGADSLLVERLQALSDWANSAATKEKYNIPIARHVSVVITTKYGRAGGFRCEERNKQAGGGVDSMHLQGRAADFHIPLIPLLDVYRYLDKTFPQSGMSIYPDAGFIHYDVRGKFARW